ncbi:MAG: SGNH/GDSL hydrolase family protein [Nostocales cyanobacterium W4_Combined_metabat2_030]|nr:SGNH/GDSL hydrolase family protein [Nostocales cyanobacterium W4_Combined_metabat2_030]
MSLQTPIKIKPTNPMADIDERYGPHPDFATALAATQGTRDIALPVAIMENGKAVEYWFESGISDTDLVKKTASGSGETATTENTAVYDPNKENDPISGFAYLAGNNYVTYSNASNPDPNYTTAQLWRCAVNALQGESPEINPEKWEFIGSEVQIVNDNTSAFYISGANPISQLKQITGVKHGDNAIFGDYNSVLRFNKDAVVGASHNPALNQYVEVFVPNDWTDVKGGWVEQSSINANRKFFSNAADIRANARNFRVNDDVIDISTGNLLKFTTGTYVDNGTTIIVPNYLLFGVAGAFLLAGNIYTAPSTNFLLQFDSTIQTAGDPGTSKIRLFNAMVVGANYLYISKTEYNNGSLVSLLSTLPANVVLYFRAKDDRTKWFNFLVTSVVGYPNYYGLNGSISACGGTLTNNDILAFQVGNYVSVGEKEYWNSKYNVFDNANYDPDNATSTGHYTILNTRASTSPEGISIAMAGLTVYKNSTTKILQILTDQATLTMWTRQYTFPAGWSAWKKVGSAHLIKDSVGELAQKERLKFEGFNVENLGNDTVVKITSDAVYNGAISLNKRKETYFAPFFQVADTIIPMPSGALGNGQILLLPFIGNGVNTLSFHPDWNEISNEFTANTAKYWLIRGERIAGEWFYKVEATTATATANPGFVTATWANDNSYIDIQFNTPIWGDSMISYPIELSDIVFTFSQNGGSATAWNTTSITKTTGALLTGGETVIRLNGSIVGQANALEYCTISVNSNSVFNGIGVAMLDSETTGQIHLSNQLDIVTQLKAIVAWDTLLLAENYDTTTNVWTTQGDLATNAVKDGALAAPTSKTSNWSNGHEAVNFDSKVLTLGTYPLFSQHVTSIVIGEYTTETGATLYKDGYTGLEFTGGRLIYAAINAQIGVDRSYVGKKFISAFGNRSVPFVSGTASVLFQNGDSNNYVAGGAYSLTKANIGSRIDGSSKMNGKIAFIGKTTGTPTVAQFIAIINALDSYYNLLVDSKYIAFEGDSQTYGIGGSQFTAFPTVLINNLESAHSETVRYVDLSVSGNRWGYVEGGSVSSDWNTTPMLSLNRISNANKLCVIWLGTNDVVGGVTAASMTASTIQYINKRIANGCTKFIVLPILSRIGLTGGFLTQAQAYNTNLSTLTVEGASIRFVDLANDPRLDDYTDLTYFGIDGIHLNDTGKAVVAELVEPKVDELLWPS